MRTTSSLRFAAVHAAAPPNAATPSSSWPRKPQGRLGSEEFEDKECNKEYDDEKVHDEVQKLHLFVYLAFDNILER